MFWTWIVYGRFSSTKNTRITQYIFSKKATRDRLKAIFVSSTRRYLGLASHLRRRQKKWNRDQYGLYSFEALKSPSLNVKPLIVAMESSNIPEEYYKKLNTYIPIYSMTLATTGRAPTSIYTILTVMKGLLSPQDKQNTSSYFWGRRALACSTQFQLLPSVDLRIYMLY